MNVPESWTERLPLLEALEESWEPVPRPAFLLASAFYAIFLVQAARGSGLPQWMDLVFIPIHEGGHLLFRFFGEFLAVAGGTLLQLAVPLLLGAYFILYPRGRILTILPIFVFIQFIEIPAVIYLFVWFAVQLYAGLQQSGRAAMMGGVAWWAHVGGFMFGIALGPMLAINRPTRQRRSR